MLQNLLSATAVIGALSVKGYCASNFRTIKGCSKFVFFEDRTFENLTDLETM